MYFENQKRCTTLYKEAKPDMMPNQIQTNLKLKARIASRNVFPLRSEIASTDDREEHPTVVIFLVFQMFYLSTKNRTAKI